MYVSALMAFVHHVAAFTLVGALVFEVAAFKPPLTIAQARRIQRADLIFGAAASVLLVVGLLRVVYFEKGPSYYFTDVFFLAKLAAFLVAGLISIYPTVLFLSWGRALKAGATDGPLTPTVPPEKIRRVRLCLMLELTAIVVILFCAPFMARGFGSLG